MHNIIEKKMFQPTKLIKNILSFLFLSFLFFIYTVGISNAQSPIVDTSGGETGKYATGDYEINDFITLAVRVAEFIWAISGSLALLAFVYGGVLFLISAGSSDKVTKARQAITGAVIGLAIVFGSYAIVFFIMRNIFGVEGNPMSSGWF